MSSARSRRDVEATGRGETRALLALANPADMAQLESALVQGGLSVERADSVPRAVAMGEFHRFAVVVFDTDFAAADFVPRWLAEGDGRTALCLLAKGAAAAITSLPASVDVVLCHDFGPDVLLHHVSRAVEFRRMRRSRSELEKMAMLGSVTAGVLHELKNPLNNLLGGMERLLSKVNTDPAVLRWGSMMRRNGEQLRDSLRDLLDGFRPEMAGEAVDLHGVLDRAILYVLKGDIAHRNIAVQKELDDDTPLVQGSAGHLLHVFLNLILNARQAMGNAGVLTVRTHWSPEGAVVEIEDTGPGIEPEAAPRLFVDFHSNKPGGSGLGLVLCQQIVARHGGTIAAENRPQGGARFRVTLPAARSSDAEPRLLP